MRTIKFRGLSKLENTWVYGDMYTGLNEELYINHVVENKSNNSKSNIQTMVVYESVSEYTGLKDKNGKEIYEGDLLKYYYIYRHVQQSFNDINPEIDSGVIRETKSTVIYNGDNTCFTVEEDVDISFILGLGDIGLFNIENIRESCGCCDEDTCDMDGMEINESILGLEVIGNIHEHKHLLK